ncbi:PREDICTED: uncharacterized protein LOC105367431 [Ceratosolen solmsi marchali]|uniref:Uncharacterized protein LOC105367431 n=1 Tax=Ceratosolen solmsi marchali TaxID=326594 RepID=A0AAJ6YU14_9HYME|nr:PREDICTED: uncharacterized protein LOC105367431 [Ceratosolen solmsi marchali]
MPDSKSESSIDVTVKQVGHTELENEGATSDFSTPDKQDARAFLRERFLRVITGVVGNPAKFHLYENTTVSAEFRGCDINFFELYVRNLTTPLGIIPDAILRTNDVILFEMEQI